ncbi:mdm2-binding protein-like [Acanthaster planci]|uniref:Mdm2-binding protein-like n=1 Tax=Acanthaster planci TaxID=133434 RepID=A0A8B7XJX7_ACAPL|nr:mdm2-binding protein-like [Acanthaster planci]
MSTKKCCSRPSFGDLCANSERYILFLSFEKLYGDNQEPLNSLLQDVLLDLSKRDSRCGNLSIPERKCHFAVVDPTSCRNEHADWLAVDDVHRSSPSKNGGGSSSRMAELQDTGENLDLKETDGVSTDELDFRLSERIHALADKLPLIGHYFDIVWLTTSRTNVPITDHVSLYGALQRLCSWHSGLLTVVCDDASPREPPHDTLNDWVNCLQGRVARGAESVAEAVGRGVAWQGEVVLADGKGQKSLRLPGFVLDSKLNDDTTFHVPEAAVIQICASPEGKPLKTQATKNTITFSRQLEVVCCVCRSDVPSQFISPLQLSLHLLPGSRLPRSEHFLHWLSEVSRSEDAAIIMRLPCRTLTPSARSSRNARPTSTKAWREHIKNCRGDIKVPDLHLTESQEFYYLLVHGDRELGQTVVAHVMYSPGDLSAVVHAQLAEYQRSLTFDDQHGARTVLNAIPSLDGSQVQTLLETIKSAQADSIKTFLEERKSEGREPTMTCMELQLLLGTVFSTAMAEIDKLSTESKAHDETYSEGDLKNGNVVSEIDCSPSHWLEKLALQNHEAAERRIKRFKSGELMLAGMAVPAPANNTIALTAEEFLKHFQASGLPSAEDLSPVSVATGDRPSGLSAGKNPPSLPCGDLKKATFEEAQKYTVPGIQYCLDSGPSQQMDSRFSKMQQRYIRYETASTCSSDQAASPATLTIPQPSSSTTDSATATVNSTSASSSPTSATAKVNSHLQRDRLSGRGQRLAEKARRSAEKGQRSVDKGQMLMRVQRSAEKRRRMVLERNHRISPGRSLSRGLKRKGQDTASVSPAKKRPIPTRKSPRKRVSSIQVQEGKPLAEKTNKDSCHASSSSSSSSSKSQAMSRSQRTRMKLRVIVKESLASRGVTKGSRCYEACIERLYKMAEMYVKDLKTSRGLNEQMKSIAEANADFVVQFEQNRIKNS